MGRSRLFLLASYLGIGLAVGRAGVIRLIRLDGTGQTKDTAAVGRWGGLTSSFLPLPWGEGLRLGGEESVQSA